MKINTSRFGEIEVDEDLVFNFIEPILGYENLSKFVLIDYTPDSPFKWLQAVEDPNVAFPVTFPGYFGLDYQFVIPEEDAKKLELSGIEDLLSVNIVCIPPGSPQAATINLLGPLVINAVNRKAMQLVLINTNFTVKHKLFGGASQEKAKTAKVEK